MDIYTVRAQGMDYAKQPAAPDATALQVVNNRLREIRNRCNIAVTNLDAFLYRATGSHNLPPQGPSAGAVAQAERPTLDEASSLLAEIEDAIGTLVSTQACVDQIS